MNRKSYQQLVPIMVLITTEELSTANHFNKIEKIEGLDNIYFEFNKTMAFKSKQ